MTSTVVNSSYSYMEKGLPIHPLNGTEGSFSSRVSTESIPLRYCISRFDNHDFLHFTILLKEGTEFVLRGSFWNHPNKELVLLSDEESIVVPF